jgi:DNA-binding NtrC family response regulator
VLVADDDPVICDVLVGILSELGHETACAGTAAEAVRTAEADSFDLVLLDLRFPDCDDLSTLTRIREVSPDAYVLIVSAHSDDLGIVAEAVRLGAFDYVPKPIRPDDIRIRVTKAIEWRALVRSHTHAVAELAGGRELDDIIGGSVAIRAVARNARELAGLDVPVLIVGETGTGKELVARALHYAGPRRGSPFVTVNCAALPRELTESELFGHEKGAFTGAHAARKGAFEDASEGTLFLDEVGDMDLPAQAALLHVLETGRFRSVGGRDKTTSARMVIATNQDLHALIRAGRFRKDLFYRVSRMRISIPPLRERAEDIPELVAHFLRFIERKVGKGVRRFEPGALEALRRYDWPGNVRELKNEVERAYIHAERESIAVLDLSPEVVAARLPSEAGEQCPPSSLEDLARLVEALRASAGNLTKAGEMLGVHRNTVRRWMKRYSLRKD